MKKVFLLVTVAIALAFSISSCTKEQNLLNKLNGDWKLETVKDDSGHIVTTTNVNIQSRETIRTFFDCNLKEKERCTGTVQTTTIYTPQSGYPTNVSASVFDYTVNEDNTLIISDGGFGETIYDIDDVSKKSLTYHEVGHPNATYEYSKK